MSAINSTNARSVSEDLVLSAGVKTKRIFEINVHTDFIEVDEVQIVKNRNIVQIFNSD